MDGVPTYVIVLIVLVALSAYFSASETAFTSYSKTKAKTEAEDGSKKAKKVLSLSDNYEKLISTILIGNNIVNIVATSLATVLFTKLFADNPELGVTVSTVVMTLAVLIFGEITPKTVAKKDPDKFSRKVVDSLSFLVKIFTPLTAIFNLWQKLVLRIFKTEAQSGITEDEIITVVEEAASEGEIDEQESELIKNVIKFSDLDVNDILTPRVDVAAVDITWDREKIASVFAETEFSRLPVYEDSLDSVVGILYQKDFANNRTSDINSLVKPVNFIFPTMKISRLLKFFQQSKSHMVVVNDEYGGTEGIVTLEDVLESLVGEIYDEHDEVVEDIVPVEENKFRTLGSTSIDKFIEFFGLEEIEDDSDITTVSGFAAHNLDKIPDEGESFGYENLIITITKTDSNRVVEAMIEVLPKETDEEEE